MKKYVMNKNVEHDGKAYAKGQEISEGDAGFKDIVDKGHADVIEFKGQDSAHKGESEKQSEQSDKSHKPARK